MTGAADADEVYAEAPGGKAPESAADMRSAALMSMPVSIAISVGKAKATIEELLAIGPKSILSLDSKIDDPVELIVGERVIARGRLVALGDAGAYGVEIIALAEGNETA